MQNGSNRGERLQIMLSPDELIVLDDFRFKNRMPSRASAVRELLKRGLAAEGFRAAAFGAKSSDYGVTGKSPAAAGRAPDHRNHGGRRQAPGNLLPPLRRYRSRASAPGASVMRYFFRLTDGKEELNPHEGIDLLGNAAAREEAVRLARDIKRGKVLAGRGFDGWFIRISISTARKWTRCRSTPCRTVPKCRCRSRREYRGR